MCLFAIFLSPPGVTLRPLSITAMKNTPIGEIIAENERRKRLLLTPYDPLTGIGCCGERVPVVRHGITLHVPAVMPVRNAHALSDVEWDLLRFGREFDSLFWK